MELKKTTKITHYVDAFDLARYLGEKMGRKIEFIDSPNDTDYSVKIEKGEIDKWDQEHIGNAIENGWVSLEYGYHAFLTYCANEGWLEEGDYVIRVSW